MKYQDVKWYEKYGKDVANKGVLWTGKLQSSTKTAK